jgi:LemA protein
MVYNTGRETFPNNLVSGLFNFAAAELFEITNPQIKEVPQVAF